MDAVTMAFGLRNVADRPRCLAEILRVLRPGGTLFVLEFSQPWAVLKLPYYLYLRGVVPWLARTITGDRDAYEYLGSSIEGFPDRRGLSREFTAAGFRDVAGIAMTGGIVALHTGRR